MENQEEPFVCISTSKGWNGIVFICTRPDPHPLDGKHWSQDRKSGITAEWVNDRLTFGGLNE